MTDTPSREALIEAREMLGQTLWTGDEGGQLAINPLARYIDALEPGSESCLSIDDKAVMERAWAERAGIGWVGKNSLILNRELGKTIIMVTHDPHAAAKARSIRQLDKGELAK